MRLNRITRLCLIFNVFFLYTGVSVCCAEIDSKALPGLQIVRERQIRESVVGECRKTIMGLNQDILELRADKELLLMNVLKLRELGRKVPDELIKSEEVLSRKITSRKADIIKMNAYIRQYMERLNDLEGDAGSEGYLTDTRGAFPTNFTPRFLEEEMAIYGERRAASEREEANHQKKRLSELVRELKSRVVVAGINDWVAVISGEAGVRMEVRLPILFPSGGGQVSDDYRRFFKKLSGFLKPYPVTVSIEGFSDGDSRTGEGMELGTVRAANVARELIKAGMEPAKLTITSRPPDTPIGDIIPSASTRAMNRKVKLAVFFNF